MLRIGYLTAMAPAEALDEEVDKLAPFSPATRRSRCAHEAHHQRIRPAANWTKRPPTAAIRRQHARRRDQGSIKASPEKRPPENSEIFHSSYLSITGRSVSAPELS